MKNFKFFVTPPKLFEFEIVHRLRKSNRCTMYWSQHYSNVVREWMSDLYFNDTYRNVNRHLDYHPTMDRTCELMDTPRPLSVGGVEKYFDVRVKVWKDNEDWMVLDIIYPIPD